MKNIKPFKNCCLENENSKMDFHVAFDKFIKGQAVKSQITEPYKSGRSAEAHGEGILFENGYKYIAYGGGCSGYDCNTHYIVDPEGNTIATYDWDGI